MGLPESCVQLMDLVNDPDQAIAIPGKEMRALQLKAAQHLFDERRGQIDVLSQRARDQGVSKIASAQDLVPLLFSHTTYKSYPESFVLNGRWKMLTKWYSTLSAVPIEIDLDRIESIDDWVDRMWAAGHYVYATSGTTGKCSFLNHTDGDRKFVERYWEKWTGWPKARITNGERFRYYAGVPKQGPQAPMHWFTHIGNTFGKPDACFHLGEPLRVSFLNRVGKMRKAMAEGTANAEDVAAFEADMAKREKVMVADIKRLAADVIEHRHEPLMISAWQIMWDIIEEARARGIQDGDFKDVMLVGMGRKHFRGPLDPFALDDAAMKLFGPQNVRPRNSGYGMTELSVLNPICEAGRYHMVPWIMLLLLDKNGNTLVERDGEVVEGRGGFLDLSREGRWGGVISGDKLTVDFSATCPCGRPGPSILDNITRYKDSADDKVDCAGTFDAYVRGVVGGEQQ